MSWKLGDEFLPYHPQASHVSPDYRDGWNHCYRASIRASLCTGHGIRLTTEQAALLLEALDIGLGAAGSVAAEYHAAMKGYRPLRHKEVDDDAAKVNAALTMLSQLVEPLEESASVRN